MFLPFAAGSYEYDRFEQSPVLLRNMYAQPSPDLPHRNMRIVPVPGLVEFATSGITGLAGAAFQSDGVLSGDVVFQAGTGVYRCASDGSVTALALASGGTAIAAGDLAPQFAASQAPELVMVADGRAYDVGATEYDDFTWSGPTGDITSVDVIAQRHLYTEAGSGRLWISDVGDAQAVTEFITAENDPDGLVCVKVHRDTIYLFGSKTIESAFITGAATPVAAFRRGFRVDMGVLAARAVTRTRRDVAFVGDDLRVYLLQGGVPQPISTEALVTAIEAVALADRDGIALESFSQGNREWLKLGLPGVGDFFADVEAGLWHRRKRIGSWESGVSSVVRAFGKLLCLDNVPSGNTALLELSSSTFTDRGNPVQRICTALVPIQSRESEVQQLVVEAQTGQAISGQDSPQVSLSVARDGRAFESPIMRDLGQVGEFRHRIVCGPLGVFYPGITIVRLEISDAAGVAFTGVQVNPGSVR